MSKKTFIDACVLMAAVRGTDEIASRAMEILDDPEREFASSDFVRLEVLPKATYNQQKAEAEFYETFFAAVRRWPDSYDALVKDAIECAAAVGLSALDSLHVAAATAMNVDEFITAEKPDKPLHRVTAVKVITIRT